MAKSAELPKTFESSIERLNEIIRELEAGNIPLDDTLKIFEEGIRLTQACRIQLTEAEEKVKTLISTHQGFEEKPGV
ncbi:MAG: exodeoxyribonuclease VII small subunit [Candidatus Marinimicrobia bacterium]|nr:exodeoxyribonuclease VII small subunit [Candidatus Neomarinimicrobiota bacterium]